MRVSHILCAIMACAPLALEARATASSEDGGSSVVAANAGEAAGRTAPDRNANTKARRTPGRSSNQTGAQTGSGSKGRDAAVAASPRRGSVTPQRLHSPLNAQARGRPARQPGGRGSTRAVTHGADNVRGPQGLSPAGQSRPAASNSAAPPAARLTSTLGNSAIGGRHAQGLGRVGGPAISRTTHSATLDGTQLRHKF